MTDDLVSSDAWLMLASNNQSCETPSEAAEHRSQAQKPRDVEILRPTTQVILVFGISDMLPALLPKGVWYQIGYKFADAEMALEIRRIETGGLAAPSHAPVMCLVHERWLSDFSSAIGGCGSLREGVFHLPAELRAIAAKAFQYALMGAARVAYRTGKGLELLCETAQLSLHEKLVPLHAGSGLSASDMQRLFVAKRMICEQFGKKLTLHVLARACGLNRAKLTRGFKSVFGVSIADALSEERLLCASVLLQTTNKPVSSIGYEAGYLNNASFTRAFTRRFGVCPSEFRARQHSVGHSARNDHCGAILAA